MATLRRLLIASTSAALIVCGTIQTAAAKGDAPLFEDVDSYTTTISANQDIADIYFPQPSNNQNYTDFPIALLLQGANVDKSNYSKFANIVASYGFIVVVPNHEKSVPQLNSTGLFAETSQIDAVLAQMSAENSNPTSPIAGIDDTDKLALLGHSYGGAVGLSAIANLCQPILCDGDYTRPDQLVAGAFFGANLRNQTTQEFIPINNSIISTPLFQGIIDIITLPERSGAFIGANIHNQNQEFTPINDSGIPIALLQGNIDSIALPERAKATYDHIQNPPKILIDISGVNHYGITNTNNPNGARSDSNIPTLDQDVAVETIARWSGLFLRASALDDKDAIDYIYSKGDNLDKNVSVTSPATPVPESTSELSFTTALVVLTVWGAMLRRKK